MTQHKTNDSEYLLKDQYRNASNLQARIALHERFTIGQSQSWFRWVIDQLAWQPNERILVCGGGSGKVWQANLDRIPAGVEIVFTDMSAGMVAEAQKNLATAANHFTFETANIASLHFADNSFDRVTANHMLYHVPDIDLAIGEVRRVLKPDGLFIAATNGESHLVELSEIGRILAPNSHWETHIKMTSYLSFNLENGAAYIKAHFNSATLHKHNSSLAVTEFEPLLAYLTSYNNIRPHITTASLAAARQYYAHILEQNDGVFPIQKATGLFRAA